MSTDERLKYLLPENIESFWLWDKNFEAVTWWNGETIAFYQEIADVINHLKPFGLPLFSELILVLAACRKNWADLGGGKALFANYLQSLDENPLQDEAGKDVVADWVRPLLTGLDNVHAHFVAKPNLERKKSILESIFEDDGHHVNQFDSSGIWIVLQTGNHAAELKERHPKGEFDSEGLLHQKASIDGHVEAIFSEGEIQEKVKIGDIIFEIELDLIPAEIGGICHFHIEEHTFCVEGETIATIRPTRTPTVGFIQTIRNLLDVLPNLDAFDSLETREETGMDALPDPAEDFTEDLPDSVAARNLIRELSRDDEDENSGIARVARNLLGILNVPRDLSDPDDMPLGGFSDIANKGDLDRLLLSELAQDDEVLAVRVALNEALYLRRETPPQDPPRQRRLFIDTGIRSWGLPRAFAHAAGLALVATMEQRDAALVFSPDADFEDPERSKLLPAELTSREKLTEALARLSPAPHPAVHLREFFADADVDSTDCDRVLITHPNVLADEEFRAVLRQHVTDEAPLLIVSIDEFGELLMSSRTASGERELRRLMLDAELLNQVPRKKKHIARSVMADRKTDPTWPLILQLDELPLRVAHPCSKLSWANTRGEVVTIVKNGVVLYYPDPKFGAIQISDSFQYSGQCLVSKFDSDGKELILVFGKKLKPQIVMIDLDRQSIEVKKTELSVMPIYAIYVDRHVVFFSQKEATVFSTQQGLVVDSTLLSQETLGIVGDTDSANFNPRVSKAQGRFIQMGTYWFAVSVNPQIKFTKMSFSSESETASSIGMFPFDSELFEEPLFLMPDGKIRVFDGNINPEILLTGTELQRMSGEVQILEGGKRVVYQGVGNSQNLGNNKKYANCDLEGKNRFQLSLRPDIRDPGIRELEPKIPTLRKKIYGISVTRVGLGLCQDRGSGHIAIQLEANGGFQLRKAGLEYGEYKDSIIPFETVESAGLGFELKQATFPDGSSVFLDARGMVHLKSSNNEIPEITFLLKDIGILSGWLSNGDFFGQPYFRGPDKNGIEESEVAAILERFLFEIRDYEIIYAEGVHS